MRLPKKRRQTDERPMPQMPQELELRGEGEGQTFFCACGYKEKLSAFQERRNREKGSKISKKEVARYLKEQEKETKAGINTALKDALSKFKLE